MRFIHAADIHLGTSFRGLRDVSPEWALTLQEAAVGAWERVVDAAISREVDFVVLAGDVFDSARPSYGDYLRFFEGLDRLDAAGIPSYLVTGNHDPYTAWGRDESRLPDSATLLGVNGPQFAVFSRDEQPLCLFGGRSYYNQAWPENNFISTGISRAAAVESLAKQYPGAEDAPFMVGIVHAGLEADQSKARANLDDLLAADVDYWACGHLHERCAYPPDGEPRVVYPGCVQGRGIVETGERGCYFVELEEASVPTPFENGGLPRNGRIAAKVRTEFIPTSVVVFQQLCVDVSACQTLADVRRLVQTELFHENGKVHCDEMMTRIGLVGRTPLHEFLANPDMLDDLRKQINNAYPSFFCDALIDKTRFPDEDGRNRAMQGLFPEIVAAMAEEQRCRDDVLVNYVQNEFVKRGIVVPGSLSDGMGEFVDEAEDLVMDLLRGDSE